MEQDSGSDSEKEKIPQGNKMKRFETYKIFGMRQRKKRKEIERWLERRKKNELDLDKLKTKGGENELELAKIQEGLIIVTKKIHDGPRIGRRLHQEKFEIHERGLDSGKFVREGKRERKRLRKRD